MNPQPKPQDQTALDKVSHFTDEKTKQLGETLEVANEKAADLKRRVESGYDEVVSPAIDSAQVSFAEATRYLQEKGLHDYLRDLESFAIRHPRMASGICIVLGWKLGRALKFGK